TLTATGPTVITGPAPVAAVNAAAGVYTLTESNLANYTAGTFSCSGGGTLVGNRLTIAASDAGKTITCSIANTFNSNPAKLGLVKTVINTGGGTATAGQFTLMASGPSVITGPAPIAAVNASVGVYVLSESNLANYTAGAFSCSGGGTLVGNQLTIAATDAGKTITCSITNTFSASMAPTGIPTLSEWGMILLVSLLAIAGLAAIRRQERSL
ncbi:IPTL-CTERM sorting domain-containing protein, partial [bacterium]|nr:IPTL-CTERM sorting domain-containing protein [bacterium]